MSTTSSTTRSSGHQPDINSVAQAGVTTGCAAALLLPAMERVARPDGDPSWRAPSDLPPTGNDYFWDDDANMHEDAINRLAAAGVTSGCGDGRVLPGSAIVTREQMAAFLRRAFD